MSIKNKYRNILMAIILVVASLVNVYQVEAKTLGDLIRELKVLEKNAEDTSSKIYLTDSQISKTKSQINQIYKDIDRTQKEIAIKADEIEQLIIEIQNKDKETKELMNFFQLSNGESAYLEYIMGANTLTDFIYRMSVTEQLSEYNKNLMQEMNNMIIRNKEAQKELAKKEIYLGNERVNLSQKVRSLDGQKQKLYEDERSLKDEILNAKAVIDMYKKAGCLESQDINVCAKDMIPYDTGFKRPLKSGYVTSEFKCPRVYYLDGYKREDCHRAMDMTDANKLSYIYATANGKVAKVFSDAFGGNQVVIHHRIIRGGQTKYYSSTYVHLRSIWVKDGDLVNSNTVVGVMGGTGGWYDVYGKYHSGYAVHLHFALSDGLRYRDYIYYDDFQKHSFNPRNVISFPSSWSTR